MSIYLQGTKYYFLETMMINTLSICNIAIFVTTFTNKELWDFGWVECPQISSWQSWQLCLHYAHFISIYWWLIVFLFTYFKPSGNTLYPDIWLYSNLRINYNGCGLELILHLNILLNALFINFGEFFRFLFLFLLFLY